MGKRKKYDFVQPGTRNIEIVKTKYTNAQTYQEIVWNC